MNTQLLVLYVCLLILFVCINGLFVAFEFALVAMRRNRVLELIDNGVRSAVYVKRLKEDMDETISGAQVGITLASLVLGWIGEPAVHELLNRLTALLPFTPPAPVEHYFAVGAMLLSFAILSMFHVVIGEQVPKGIALRFPEKLLLTLAGPFLIYRRIIFPLIFVFTRLSKLVLRMLGMNSSSGHEPVHTSDELSLIIDGSQVAGELDRTVTNVLQKALDLQDLTVAEVMVPLADVDMVEQDVTFKSLICIANDSKHSRLPVYKGERSNIVGVFSTKDLFDVIETTLNSLTLEAKLGSLAQYFKLRDYQRSILKVTVGVKASSLLHLLLVHKMPMALVMDDPETKVFVGIVTLEDLLERLVGEISDEYDH